jgi:alkyldihydroxyacetonephosphate synthase
MRVRRSSRSPASCAPTITPHPAVGTDHRPWLVDEIGQVGIDVLRAIKAVVDPDGILNPGVLVP